MNPITASIIMAITAAQSAPMDGISSWYGEAHQGKTMANGEPFDMNKLTCASWYYPLGTKLIVRSVFPKRYPLKKGFVVVTVTDRGPAMQLVRKGRIIDLSKSAFSLLAPLEVGTWRVSVKPQ